VLMESKHASHSPGNSCRDTQVPSCEQIAFSPGLLHSFNKYDQ
jgi:hypothetical protein